MKKIKTVVAALSLSTTLSLIGGCGVKEYDKVISVGDGTSEVCYKDNTLSGTISYSNLENGYIKIVTLTYKEKELEPKLIAIYHYKYRSTMIQNDTLNYIDLDTGVTLLSYFYPNCYSEDAKPEVKMGENFEIVEEISLFDYIVEDNWYQDEYTINELIEFYNDKVKPTLESEETNDLTRKPNFRQNI